MPWTHRAAALLLLLLCGAGAAADEGAAARLKPTDLEYVGAFRLPGPSGGSNWEYSGYALAYCPVGDAEGEADGYPGSLFIVGHDHHQLVSEISIPVPKRAAAKQAQDLPTAKTLQPFADVTAKRFGELEIPRAGLAWLPSTEGGRGLLHHCWGQHNEDARAPTHGWSRADLAKPKSVGPWHLARYTNYVTNDYLFEIPEAWAAKHAPGMRLASGRFRDGQWGGLGPTLIAYAPPTGATLPARGASITETKALLLYGTAAPGALEVTVRADQRLKGFNEADEWSGGAWLTAGKRAAVVLAGTKGTGKAWYGFSNGVVYPTRGSPGDAVPPVPPWPHDARGWWSAGVSAQLLFFDPADLAAVVAGTKKTWEPQPYALLKLDEFLFDPGFDYKRAKRYLLGAISFDRTRGILYVVERRADEDKSLIHTFRIKRG